MQFSSGATLQNVFSNNNNNNNKCQLLLICSILCTRIIFCVFSYTYLLYEVFSFHLCSCSYHLHGRRLHFQWIYRGRHNCHGQFKRRLQVRHWLWSPWRQQSHVYREQFVLNSWARLPSCRMSSLAETQQRIDNRIRSHLQQLCDLFLWQKV